MQTSIRWSAHSDQGRRRTNNEDSWGAFRLDALATPLPKGQPAWPSHGMLFILSDGMGGANAGEVASRFCVDHLAIELQARRGAVDRKAAMAEAFVAVHQALSRSAEADTARRGMGATLSALWLVPDGSYVLGHIGDSRVYLRRANSWSQITDDHSVGAGMVRRGELTPEVVARMKFRGLLEQVMGGDGAPIEPQILVGHQAIGDAWLMCSDGLHGPLGDDLGSVSAAAMDQLDLTAGASALVAAANEAGGPDNITVILACAVPAVAG